MFLPEVVVTRNQLDDQPNRLPHLRRGQWIRFKDGTRGRWVGWNMKTKSPWVHWCHGQGLRWETSLFSVKCSALDWKNGEMTKEEYTTLHADVFPQRQVA